MTLDVYRGRKTTTQHTQAQRALGNHWKDMKLVFAVSIADRRVVYDNFVFGR